jgi:ketosteroid isomerase-like protein
MEKPMNKEAIKIEIKNTSNEWIKSFNAGDLERCSERYLKDAIMDARPINRFIGREKIYNFWNDFVKSSNATDLTYTDIEINIIDQNTAILSAKWSMNVGRGFITKELWIKTGNEWFLSEDDFTIEEQY